MPHDVLLLTCEHGGNHIPAPYRPYFASASARAALNSHRGYDPGALELARSLAKRLRAPLLEALTSRLLVEVNRSIGHRQLFSEFTRGLSRRDRRNLLARHYFPHRQQVEQSIRARLAHGLRVVHVGVHTFTPRWHGRSRVADVGLLYDPSRAFERAFCQRWKQTLGQLAPDLRVRRNYPYLGVSDGLVTYLRRRFSRRAYAAVELEVSQALLGQRRGRRHVTDVVASSLAAVLNGAD